MTNRPAALFKREADLSDVDYNETPRWTRPLNKAPLSIREKVQNCSEIISEVLDSVDLEHLLRDPSKR